MVRQSSPLFNSFIQRCGIYNSIHPLPHDSNWFFVTDPGEKIEFNVFKWMRFSPGVSYRMAFGSEAKGLSDEALSHTAYNLTLKFGKF